MGLGFGRFQNAWGDISYRGLIGAVSSMYVRKYVSSNLKQETNELVKYIRKALQTSLEKSEWMDNVTNSNAMKKLDAMKQSIAYPKELLNKAFVDGFFEGKSFKTQINLTGLVYQLNPQA